MYLMTVKIEEEFEKSNYNELVEWETGCVGQRQEIPRFPMQCVD